MVVLESEKATIVQRRQAFGPRSRIAPLPEWGRMLSLKEHLENRSTREEP
jgi:hypothetical protein